MDAGNKPIRFELDGNYRSILVGLSPFLLVPMWTLVVGITREHSGLLQTALVGVAFSLPVFLWVFAYGWKHPSHFEIAADGIRIAFLTRARLIPAEEITEVKIVDPSSLSWWAKFLSLLGMYAMVWTDETRTDGTCDVHIGDHDRLVLVRTRDGRPVIFGPDLPGRFHNAVAELIAAQRKAQQEERRRRARQRNVGPARDADGAWRDEQEAANPS